MKTLLRIFSMTSILVISLVCIQCSRSEIPSENDLSESTIKEKDSQSASLTANQVSAKTTLKIMVWNIDGGSSDITAVANYIKSVDPDVVGLNEVYESQISTIMNILGSSYQRTFHNLKTNADFGNLTISKKTIEGSATQRWTYSSNSTHGCDGSGDNGNRQGLMKTKIAIGSGKFLFFYNTHFGRECQTSVQNAQIAEFKNWSNTHGGRKIAVGDFNFQPSSAQHSSITTGGPNFFDPLGSAYHFKTWKVGSSTRNKRLDYILGNGWTTFISTTRGTSTASDHYPVIANVSIKL